MVTIQGFQTNLFCDRLEACVQFFERLGMHTVFHAPDSGPPEHVEMEAAGVRIGLTSAAAANRLVSLGVTASGCVSTEVVLWVDDVDRIHATALAAGATEVVAPVDSPDDRLHYSWVRDPDGHQVKFVRKL